MGGQQGQGCRRDAVKAGGLADGPRPHGSELLPDLVGEPAQLRIVQALRQLQALVPPIGRDVGRLAREIDLVLRVDLELPGDLRRELTKAWPDPASSAIPMFGCESSSNALRRWPSLLRRSPWRSASLGVNETERAKSRAAPSVAIFDACRRRRVAPTQPMAMPLSVRRWSALSARSVSRYSAREVNIRYGSVTPRVTKSSIITAR